MSLENLLPESDEEVQALRKETVSLLEMLPLERERRDGDGPPLVPEAWGLGYTLHPGF